MLEALTVAERARVLDLKSRDVCDEEVEACDGTAPLLSMTAAPSELTRVRMPRLVCGKAGAGATSSDESQIATSRTGKPSLVLRRSATWLMVSVMTTRRDW